MVFNHLLDSGPKTRENVGSCWTERGEYGPLKRSTDSSPNLHLNITENTMRFGSHLKKKQHWLKVNNCRAGWDHSQSFSHSCLCLICISYTHQCAKNYFRATQLPGRSDFIFTCGISMYLHPSGFMGRCCWCLVQGTKGKPWMDAHALVSKSNMYLLCQVTRFIRTHRRMKQRNMCELGKL